MDEAILGVYLAGGKTRRIKGALAPLLGGGPLSKDAVSRLVGRLRESFDLWPNWLPRTESEVSTNLMTMLF